ncbi:MAG: DUF1801 domain-containing protein [Acidobacteriota bacterium]|nr:DUF1801 domain-containing protein [Acidobacteriota bacterium]
MKSGSKPATVAEYIADLPEDRRRIISKVRGLLKRRVPKGYQESMLWGAITYSIPLERFPDTYNGQPLCYAALASHKSHLSLYVMCVYGDRAQTRKLQEGFRKAGKKLDMGKACIRFRALDDLPLEIIGDLVAAVPPEKYLESYKKSREPGARKARAK